MTEQTRLLMRLARAVLARYAGLLGRNSLAAACLRDYDDAKKAGSVVEIHRTNNGFRLVLPNKCGPDGTPLARRYG